MRSATENTTFISCSIIRIAGERNTDLELALLAVGQAAGEPPALEVHAPHQLLGALQQVGKTPHRREEVERPAAPHLHGKPQILDDAEIGKQIVALEGAPQAHAADAAR